MGLKGSWRCFPVTRSLMKSGKERRGREKREGKRGREYGAVKGISTETSQMISSETLLYLFWLKSPEASCRNPQNTGKFWLSSLPGVARDFTPCDSVHSNMHDKDHGGVRHHKWEVQSQCDMLLNSLLQRKHQEEGPIQAVRSVLKMHILTNFLLTHWSYYSLKKTIVFKLTHRSVIIAY